MPPLQVLSPRLAGEGARLAAPAGSGLRARAAAGSAWASPAASRARRARCTSARLAHGGDERSRRVGGEALLPLPVLRGWSQTSHLAGK